MVDAVVWVVVGVGLWVLLGVPAALLLGRVVGAREEQVPGAGRRSPDADRTPCRR